MPISRAEPTTDHAANETSTRASRLHMPGDRSSDFADATPAPKGSALATDATTDHDDDITAEVGTHELRHERFEIGDILGEGGMGVVYRAILATAGRSRSSS
jgi:hypothetical protein